MAAYADTSFLYALFLTDPNSAAAAAYVRKHRLALVFTSWQRCELRNAMRLAVFRGHTDAATTKAALAQVERDQESGNLQEAHLSWPDTLAAADKIGDKHTALLGIRTLDLLHIGAALSLGHKDFLTFDHRQRACAEAAGLRIGP
jgi:predicted nucleic acid-binding protein